MKEEAIKRMLKLGLESGPINDLLLRDKLVCSDNGMFKDVHEEILQNIKDWESKYNNFVCHVIHSNLYGLKISVVNGFGTYGGWFGANPGTTNEKAITALQRAYEMELKGDKLYLIWNDCCNRDAEKTIYVLHEKSKEELWDHIDVINHEYRCVPF